MKLAFISLLLTLLIGCAMTRPKSSPLPTGERVEAPRGWEGYESRGGD